MLIADLVLGLWVFVLSFGSRSAQQRSVHRQTPKAKDLRPISNQQSKIRMMDLLFKDIRYAVRSLLKWPGFTTIAVLTLALGIGANAAIFSVVNAVLLKPLKFRDPERLVMIWEEASFAGFPRNTPATANYVDWKTQNRSFEDMAASASTNFNITGDGEPEHVDARKLTYNFLPLLGVQPFIGRTFTAEDDKPGAPNVAIISYALWQSRYGSDRAIVNSSIQLNGEKYTVIGVMPRGFQFIDKEEKLWVPIAFTPEDLTQRGSHFLNVVARLKSGVTLKQAQADMNAVMRNISKDHVAETFDGKLGAVVLPMREQLAGDVKLSLLVLLVAVSFVLLIACANIASLLLARAAGRRREIAVKTALGASRVRIVRQLLTESLILSLAGGLLGLLLAYFSFSFLEKLIPVGLTLSTNLKLDGTVLLFALGVSIVTGVVFGLAPALHAARVDLNEALKQSGGRGASVSGAKLRSATVVMEVALSLVLLVGAGLLIQTLFGLFNQYSVIQPEKVLTLRTQLPRTKYKDTTHRSIFYQQVLERVQSLPGVVSSGYTTSVPLAWKGGTNGFYPEGLKNPIPGMAYDANHRQISADYLKTLNIALRQGRYFDEHDNAQSMKVAIINETMAKQYWPGEKVLGRRFKLGDPNEDVPWISIVGVVADIRQMGLDEPVKAEMYFPHSQVDDAPWFAPRDLAIRTTGDPMAIVDGVRGVVHAVDPDQPISNVALLSELLGEEGAQRQMGMVLLSAFAILALILASLGIYGVLAYFVAQHRNEIGVRLALGASPLKILWFVIKKGMTLTIPGVAVGVFVAFGLTRLMRSLLFGVGATDPLTFVGVPFLLLVVSLLACWIPARRAAKVDPMTALRYE
ncbi:MAG: ABC transporter permease [Blastocatellia bacterium]|nr:MAG: ABC transporter permease [Blastocatellia bacterium]